MYTRKFRIAGGNETALVYECEASNEEHAVSLILPTVEQVGFVRQHHQDVFLKMMGDELCVDAILALASSLSEEKTLSASGVKGVIHFLNGLSTSVSLDLPYEQIEGLVLFDAIGYLVQEGTPRTVTQKELSTLCTQHNRPAFGVVTIMKDTIHPVVYVKQTHSYCEESACGSGSIAAHIVTGLNSIVQPTGLPINIKSENGTRFTIEAHVEEV